MTVRPCVRVRVSGWQPQQARVGFAAASSELCGCRSYVSVAPAAWMATDVEVLEARSMSHRRRSLTPMQINSQRTLVHNTPRATKHLGMHTVRWWQPQWDAGSRRRFGVRACVRASACWCVRACLGGRVGACGQVAWTGQDRASSLHCPTRYELFPPNSYRLLHTAPGTRRVALLCCTVGCSTCVYGRHTTTARLLRATRQLNVCTDAARD
jgi:hypothetical protein